MLETTHSAAVAATASERDVISQIRLAFANRLPLTIGALIGALVPIATYTVGHAELGEAGWVSLPGAIVIGGCGFSALTVYKWGRRAFDSELKALGFVILSEGVMSFSHTPWLSLVVLAFLTAINAVANGANLAVAYLDAEARRTAAIAAAVPAPSPLPEAVLLGSRLDRLEADLGQIGQIVAAAVAAAIPPVQLAAPAQPALAGEDAALQCGNEDAAPAEKPAAAPRRKTGVKVAKAPRAARRAPAVVN